RRVVDGWRSLLARLVAAPDAPVTEALSALPARPRPQGPQAVLAALAERRGTADGGPAEMPRTETERRLAAIWAEVLGLAEVGRNADFFELGGHSLAAVRVLSRVKAEFGRDVPLTGLFTTPTVAGLAALLTEAPGPAGPLVRLRAGRGTPVVLAHALGGHAAAYAELARAMPGDRAVYALEHPGLSGTSVPEGVAELAAQYAQAIAAELPTGPLVVGGWSAGGAIAHELACQLQAAGREVPLLALIDAAVPSGATLSDALGEVDSLVAFAQDLGAREGRVPDFGAPELAALPESERLTHVVDWARREKLLPADLDDATLQRHQAVFVANLRAHLAHRMRRFEGNGVLFRAAASDHADSAAWEPWMRRHVTLEVPGAHHGVDGVLGSRHVATLADALERAIASDDVGRP
ncbi:MAG: alpha/beta fold hydrolase, partial [Candidatus Sericytochromatia bacterium]